MSRTEQVKPAELRGGDAIDLSPLLDAPGVHGWVWQPFGADEQARREAIESARLVAECELAVVESVESVDGGNVVIYNDQLNLTVPGTHLVERTVV